MKINKDKTQALVNVLVTPWFYLKKKLGIVALKLS
jgi:hypothetical protein